MSIITPRGAICDLIGKYPEKDANARLIAAAPDLLAALQCAVGIMRRECEADKLGGDRFDLTDCKEMKTIFAALAKAQS